MGRDPIREVEMSPKNSNNTRAKRRAKDASKVGRKYTAALRGDSTPGEQSFEYAVSFSHIPPNNSDFNYLVEDALATEHGAGNFKWSGDKGYHSGHLTFDIDDPEWYLDEDSLRSMVSEAASGAGVSADEEIIVSGPERTDDSPFGFPELPSSAFPAPTLRKLDEGVTTSEPVHGGLDDNVMTYHLDERAEESQITGDTWYDDNDEPHYPAYPQSPPIEDPGNPVEYLVKLDYPVTDMDVASQLVQSIQEDDIYDEGLIVEWLQDDELGISTYSTTYEPDAESINDSLREITEGISGDGNDDAVFYHSVTFDPPVTYPDVVHRIESDLSSYPKIEWSADGREMRVFVHDEESVSKRPLDEDHLQALAHQYHAELHIPYLTQQEAEADL